MIDRPKLHPEDVKPSVLSITLASLFWN